MSELPSVSSETYALFEEDRTAGDYFEGPSDQRVTERASRWRVVYQSSPDAGPKDWLYNIGAVRLWPESKGFRRACAQQTAIARESYTSIRDRSK